MPETTDTKMIVGLGNPGNSYTDTRHNAGFMALSIFSSRYRLTSQTTIGQAVVIVGDVLDKGVILVWPLSLMANSGKEVRELFGRFKIENLENLLVLHDDMDVAPGAIKISQGGPPEGHDGLNSVRAAVGEGFAHLHLGIGPPVGEGGETPSPKDYVLAPFEFDELNVIRPAFMLSAEVALAWLTEGIEASQKLLSERA
jgi:PTH1 family peptidyl-tRNA hydrolase